MQNLILPIDYDARLMVNRYGFNASLALAIADEVGGLWQVGGDGFGRELMAPFRCCIIGNFERHKSYYELHRMISMQSVRLAIFD